MTRKPLKLIFGDTETDRVTGLPIDPETGQPIEVWLVRGNSCGKTPLCEIPLPFIMRKRFNSHD